MNVALLQTALTTLRAIAISNPGLSNVPPRSTIQSATSQDSTLLIATAYTDQALPTLYRGNRGRDVKKLQQILLDNGFLAAASARLGTGMGALRSMAFLEPQPNLL